MAATDPSDKREKGKPKKRRYFRRRRRKETQENSLAAERSADAGEAQSAPRRADAGEAQSAPRRARAKSQSRRRRSSRRRGSAARAAPVLPPRAEEESPPQADVYIYTHIIRPSYRDGAGGEFYADHSLNLSDSNVDAPIGIDPLLESIGRQLDAWFQPDADPTEGGEAQGARAGAAPGRADGSALHPDDVSDSGIEDRVIRPPRTTTED